MLTLDGKEWVELTLHAETGESRVVYSPPERVVENAKFWAREGYWDSHKGAATLHACNKVDVHATPEEMRIFRKKANYS